MLLRLTRLGVVFAGAFGLVCEVLPFNRPLLNYDIIATRWTHVLVFPYRIPNTLIITSRFQNGFKIQVLCYHKVIYHYVFISYQHKIINQKRFEFSYRYLLSTSSVIHLYFYLSFSADRRLFCQKHALASCLLQDVACLSDPLLRCLPYTYVRKYFCVQMQNKIPIIVL